jgi:LITAF-like zinc ribbon domain
MLTFACPECRHNHDWPDDWLGERVDCPECGKLITLSRPQRGRSDEDEPERRDPPRRHYDDPDDRGDRDDRDDRDLRRSIKRRDYDDRDDEYARDGSRREITCPQCDYVGRPNVTKEMAENAWIFIVLGIFFLPLIILGVLMKDTWEVCPECRKRIRKVGGVTFG